MLKVISFIGQIVFTFFNVFLFQIIWNEGILYFFPVLPMLTYWQVFVLAHIKSIFGLHIHFSAKHYIKFEKENKSEIEISWIETLTVSLSYLICIVLIKFIL